MLAILLKLFEIFTSEIAKKLADKAVFTEADVCRDLLRLYVVLEEFLHDATNAYQVFQFYVNNFSSLKNDVDYKRRMRIEARELVNGLKRFEKHLKRVFIKLKLIDESDLSIRLAEVPESSYSLFKKHFVEDLAPKFIADKSGTHYVLRLTSNKTEHALVSTNHLGHLSLDLERLFKEGDLVYELIDFSNRNRVVKVLEDCTEDLLKLKKVTEALHAVIRNNCNILKLL